MPFIDSVKSELQTGNTLDWLGTLFVNKASDSRKIEAEIQKRNQHPSIIVKADKISKCFLAISSSIDIIKSYNESMYKIYKWFEIQLGYFSDSLFPDSSNKERTNQPNYGKFLTNNDTYQALSQSTQNDEELDSETNVKNQIFNYMLFEVNPDARLTRAEIQQNQKFIEFAQELKDKYQSEKVSPNFTHFVFFTDSRVNRQRLSWRTWE